MWYIYHVQGINNFFSNLLFSKKYAIVRHLLFWFIMYTDLFLTLFGLSDNEFDLTFFAVQIISDFSLVYINLYVFIPRYLNRKNIDRYFLATIFMIVGMLIVNYFIINHFYPETEDIAAALFRSFLLTMGILGTAIALKIIKRTLISQQKLRTLEKLNYDTEVNYLKMQVNPHFLFNTLNNIYVQSKKYPEVVPDSIMRLSDLMRYQIYKGSKKTVHLEEEMKFLKDYLDLESLRKDNLTFNFKKGNIPSDLVISPLLFIPLVENAVKHSGNITKPNNVINIYCTYENGEIIFTINNPMSSKSQKTPGIGLKNLKRRLELLFPDKHYINIAQEDNFYSVTMRIQTP